MNIFTFTFFLLHADKLGIDILDFNVRLYYFFSIPLVTYFIFFKKLSLINFDKLIWILLLILYTFLSSLWSLDAQRTLAMSGLAAITIYTSFLLPHAIVERYGPIKTIRWFVLASILVGTYGILQTLFSIIGFNDPFADQVFQNGLVRAGAFAYEPSFYLLFLVPSSVIVIVSQIVRQKNQLSFSLITAVYITICFLVSMSATSIFLIPIIFFSFLFLKTLLTNSNDTFLSSINFFGFIKFFIPISFIFILLIILYGDLSASYFLRVFLVGDITQHHSTAERFVQIYNAYIAFFDAPFFGHGLGGVGQYIHDRYLQGDYFLFSPSRPFFIDPSPRFFDPTNVTIEMLSSYGIFGSILYLYGFIRIIFTSIFLIKDHNVVDEERYIAFTLLLAFIITIFFLNVNSGLFRTYIWFMLGLLDATIAIIIRDNKKKYDYKRN